MKHSREGTQIVAALPEYDGLGMVFDLVVTAHPRFFNFVAQTCQQLRRVSQCKNWFRSFLRYFSNRIHRGFEYSYQKDEKLVRLLHFAFKRFTCGLTDWAEYNASISILFPGRNLLDMGLNYFVRAKDFSFPPYGKRNYNCVAPIFHLMSLSEEEHKKTEDFACTSIVHQAWRYNVEEKEVRRLLEVTSDCTKSGREYADAIILGYSMDLIESIPRCQMTPTTNVIAKAALPNLPAVIRQNPKLAGLVQRIDSSNLWKAPAQNLELIKLVFHDVDEFLFKFKGGLTFEQVYQVIGRQVNTEDLQISQMKPSDYNWKEYNNYVSKLSK